jgi:glutathione S-transferase
MSEPPVVLQKYFPVWSLTDLSPFCSKVEAYLRMAEIPYRGVVGDPRKAPKQKLPVLQDGELLIPDSNAILAHLESTRGRPLDARLSPHQQAIATAVRSMIEEQLYFLVVYLRWKSDAAWAIYQPVFIELAGQLGVPGFMRGFVSNQVRKQMLRALHGQGTGRHTPEEIVTIGKGLIDSVAELCEGPFYFGAEPSTLDATVYAFGESLVQAPFEGPVKDHAARRLGSYLDHVRARYFAPATPVTSARSQDAALAGSVRTP